MSDRYSRFITIEIISLYHEGWSQILQTKLIWIGTLEELDNSVCLYLLKPSVMGTISEKQN